MRVKRVCAICQSLSTYLYKGAAQWHHDDKGNLICKSCYDNLRRAKNPEYVKIYRIIYQPRATHLALVRRSIRRGWGKID